MTWRLRFPRPSDRLAEFSGVLVLWGIIVGLILLAVVQW